jgi:hypothetical protein
MSIRAVEVRFLVVQGGHINSLLLFYFFLFSSLFVSFLVFKLRILILTHWLMLVPCACLSLKFRLVHTFFFSQKMTVELGFYNVHLI